MRQIAQMRDQAAPSSHSPPPTIVQPSTPLLSEPPINCPQYSVPHKKTSDTLFNILMGTIVLLIAALGISLYFNYRCWKNRRQTQERHRDQSENNTALLPVRGTFDEELYRRRSERGPQTRETEREASRGFNDNARDRSGVLLLDSQNTETFGCPSGSFSTRPFSEAYGSKANDGTQASSSFSPVDEEQLTEPTAGRELNQLASSGYARRVDEERRMTASHFREQHSQKIGGKEHKERKAFVDVTEEAQISKFNGSNVVASSVKNPPFVEDKPSSSNSKEVNSDKGCSSSSATANAPPSSVSSKDQVQEDSSGHPGSSKAPIGTLAPSISSRPGLLPSSSMGSLSSEKSRLNPYTKEFKLNPNAKSFTPSQTPLRPSSLVSDASTVPHTHGAPMGLGIGPSSGGPQPAVYNPMATPMQPPQSFIHPNGPPLIGPWFRGPPPAVYNPMATPMQSPQSFIHPNAPPLYGQQMILGHPGQVLYMPSYPPDTQYEGREY